MKLCTPDICTGCMACRESCPVGAIETVVNDEGFQEPRMEVAKCISCGKCERVCPVLNPPAKDGFSPVGYSGWDRDDATRRASSSGGVFSVLATRVLETGGVVFGVAFDADFVARQTRIDKVEDLPKLRGSKYVQADVGNVYSQVKSLLADSRKVLFCGTPCQIAALINYLGGRNDNLILVDFVCHGVPSPRVFEDYKAWLKRHHGFVKFDAIQFRDKYFGWNLTNMRICGTGGRGDKITYIKSALFDVYRNLFDADLDEREACFKCKFTEEIRNSDITLADWWGGYRPKGYPEEDDFSEKGVSLVLVNSEKGSRLLADVKERLFTVPRTLPEVYKTNKCFRESYPMPANRKEFWDYYRANGFEETVRKYAVPKKWPLHLALRVSMRRNAVTHIVWKIFELEYRLRHRMMRIAGIK